MTTSTIIYAGLIQALAEGNEPKIKTQTEKVVSDLRGEFAYVATHTLQAIGSAANQQKLTEELIVPAFLKVLESPEQAKTNLKVNWVYAVARIGSVPHFKDLASEKIIPAIEKFGSRNSDVSVVNPLREIQSAHHLKLANPA